MAQLENLDIKTNGEEVEELKEAYNTIPNITIRNNSNVYVTINYFNETEKEYSKLEE